jgi:PEGA domain
MEILSEPKHKGGGRRGVLLLMLGLVAAAVAVVSVVRRPAASPPPRPEAPRARRAPTPRATPSAPPRSQPAEALPAAPLPSLRVDSDVPGATVFLDRRFLGTTPVETGAFEPGTHRLNVSAEGYEMYAESVDLTPGPNQVMVRFKEVRLDERVAVAHKHGVGSCRGVLHATTAGLRFEADRPGDSFEAPLASLEALQVDYIARNLRVKQKAGKTWNFTSDSADALLVFQKKVEAARARL